jgi:hypothetical protein
MSQAGYGAIADLAFFTPMCPGGNKPVLGDQAGFAEPSRASAFRTLDRIIARGTSPISRADEPPFKFLQLFQF